MTRLFWVRNRTLYRYKVPWPETPAEALEESIAKWEFIVAWLGERPLAEFWDRGPRTCALCHLYFANDCYGCIVSKTTGKIGCRSTPYSSYEVCFSDYELRYAREELSFLEGLKSLLHQGEG
jgi:hypothetical protein